MRCNLTIAFLVMLAATSAGGQTDHHVTATCQVLPPDKQQGQAEITEFREGTGKLTPATKFDVTCRVASDAQFRGEVLIWTSIDFLVAPATTEFASISDQEKVSHVSWAQLTEMRDLRAITVTLNHNQSRTMTLGRFDLWPVIAAFPRQDSDDLWPWLMNVHVHIQDREGQALASTDKLIPLRPNHMRIR